MKRSLPLLCVAAPGPPFSQLSRTAGLVIRVRSSSKSIIDGPIGDGSGSWLKGLSSERRPFLTTNS